MPSIPAIEQLVLLIAFYYVVFSLMLIGGGMVLGGPAVAGAVARFLFGRPVQMLLIAVLALLRWFLTQLWQLVRWVLRKLRLAVRWTFSTIWALGRDFLLWPLMRATAAMLHLAAVGFADTVHFLLTGRGR